MPDADAEFDMTRTEVDALHARQARRALVAAAIVFVIGAGLFIVTSRLAANSIGQSIVSWLGVFGIFGGLSVAMGSAIRLGYLRRGQQRNTEALDEIGVQQIWENHPDGRGEHDQSAEDSE
jgi:hypothetical protein